MVSLLIRRENYFEILRPQLIIFSSVPRTKQFLPMIYLFPFSFFLYVVMLTNTEDGRFHTKVYKDRAFWSEYRIGLDAV